MIGIIGAMDKEIELLLLNMEHKTEETIANSHFYRGKLGGKDVVLLQSGIGKVNAAMSTTIMMERYKPELIINTGSAGGFAEQLEVGDIIISKDVVHHDVDATAFNYAHGQVPGMPEVFTADKHLIELTKEVIGEMDVNYEVGLIATADSFMSDPVKVRATRKLFPEMIASEMEAAAIAQVSYQYKIPFVVIRALSDIAGKDSSVSFDEFLELAAINASQLIIKVLNKLD